MYYFHKCAIIHIKEPLPLFVIGKQRMGKRDLKLKIEYHADDFALFYRQSQRILECYHHGRLNGLSILPNSAELHRCLALLPLKTNRDHKLSITIHLNLIEGKSLCAPEQIPLLVDKSGNLNGSFGNLLLHSFLPDRQAYRAQLQLELAAQIRALLPLFQGQPLRLDSHAHYHMIPVVFDALMDVLHQEQWEVSYIRIPKEHPTLYLRHWFHLHDIAPINLVKVGILNLLAWRNQRKYRHALESLDKSIFLGVFLSGRMYRKNVETLLPDARALADKAGAFLEILAHPGGIQEPEDIAHLTNHNDIDFLTSPRREKETTLFFPAE